MIWSFIHLVTPTFQEQVKIRELGKEKAILESRDRMTELRIKKAQIAHTYGIIFEVWGEAIAEIGL